MVCCQLFWSDELGTWFLASALTPGGFLMLASRSSRPLQCRWCVHAITGVRLSRQRRDTPVSRARHTCAAFCHTVRYRTEKDRRWPRGNAATSPLIGLSCGPSWHGAPPPPRRPRSAPARHGRQSVADRRPKPSIGGVDWWRRAGRLGRCRAAAGRP